MNGFQLQALGWVILMSQRKITIEELQKIAESYGVVEQCAAEDRATYGMMNRIIGPRRIVFSRKTTLAAKALIELMVRLRPDVFAPRALRIRRNYWLKMAAVNFLIVLAASTWIPDAFSWKGNLVFVSLIFSMFSTVPSMILFRATGLIERLLKDPKDT